ncbi:MAG TPA: hypothetical protein VJG32_21730 [Anaerolineae bacterium]|nr:hypothetical protein [Anaerolineae bacterium]
MKKTIGLVALATLVIVDGLIVQSGAEERAVRRIIDEVQAAALNSLNFRDPNALDEYFATVAEGAQAAGLAETQQAYKDFVAGLSAGDITQFHSFDIKTIEVHQDAGLAKVTYRLHFSVVRNGFAVFGARATQDLALLKTPRGWRISGGDAPQLEDVIGAWPPR